jgi:hypothetical protein
MKEAPSSSERFLQEPHGVTSQKMPFFTDNNIYYEEYSLLDCKSMRASSCLLGLIFNSESGGDMYKAV